MITATCTNETCQQNGIGYNFVGVPAQVQCGECRDWCEVTDERDDPPMPDDLPVGV